VANRRITEFPSINGADIVDQDLLTLVQVFEVDPTLRNKKITFSEFREYLNLYYSTISGPTFSGNVIINGDLNVSGDLSAGTVRCNTAFTVATLPAGGVGDLARVTDANAPSAGAPVTGGGAANALCWYNGTNWTVLGV